MNCERLDARRVHRLVSPLVLRSFNPVAIGVVVL